MDSELVSGSSGPGWSLGWDIVLCSWARQFTHSASFHPSVQMGTSKFNAAMNQRSIQEYRNIPSCFMLQEQG